MNLSPPSLLILRLILPVLLAAATISCSRHPQVTVVNESASPLLSVVVSGNGFSKALGPLAVGEKRTVEVIPTSETDLAFTFEALGVPRAPLADGYFGPSGGYRVTARVRPDFTVKVESVMR